MHRKRPKVTDLLPGKYSQPDFAYFALLTVVLLALTVSAAVSACWSVHEHSKYSASQAGRMLAFPFLREPKKLQVWLRLKSQVELKDYCLGEGGLVYKRGG